MNDSNCALEEPWWNQQSTKLRSSHPSGQKHQNKKNDEKKHEECYDHDLPLQTGLLNDHCHPFLRTTNGEKIQVVGILNQKKPGQSLWSHEWHMNASNIYDGLTKSNWRKADLNKVKTIGSGFHVEA
jgi:hypothetical protein